MAQSLEKIILKQTKKRLVVITGCSKQDGVGYQLTKQLLQRGHTVIATVRDLKTSELQQNSFPQTEQLRIKPLDLCDPLSIQRFATDVLSEFSYIDVLVNNAANVVIGPVETVSVQDMQTTFQTKVFGPISLIQAFLPAMRARRSGLLFTTSSLFCTCPFSPPGIPLYLAALSAFERIQENLAIELAPWNIKVANFQPGPITTHLSRFEGARADIKEQFYPHYTEKAYGWYQGIEWKSAEEVAAAYADVVEQNGRDFCSQSDPAGRAFVKKNRRDPSSNTDRNALLRYIKETSR